jgi:glycosyltransferase involved in cell wall biosynthesis
VKVLINAISVKEGGSKVVLNKFLEQFIVLHPQHEWYVATNSVLYRSMPAHPAVKPLIFDYPGKSPFHLRYWYEFVLPSIIRKFDIELLFSQTNYLPARKSSCPSLLLVQHAGHFSSLFCSLMEAHLNNPVGRWLWRIKGKWVQNSVRYADHVTVQTQALAKRIVKKARIQADKITVISHGPGLVEVGSVRSFKEHAVWKIGCITKFGVQKNFSTVFAAIRRIRDKHQIRLLLSLDEGTAEYAAVKMMILKAGIEDLVDNLGEVEEADIQKIYNELDVFIFPSLCESFGFPLVEAMSRGLPVVAADISSTTEIGGDAILKFPPMDSRALADQLDVLLTDKAAYELRSKLSLDRAQHFSWQESANQTAALMEQVAASSR